MVFAGIDMYGGIVAVRRGLKRLCCYFCIEGSSAMFDEPLVFFCSEGLFLAFD